VETDAHYTQDIIVITKPDIIQFLLSQNYANYIYTALLLIHSSYNSNCRTLLTELTDVIKVSPFGSVCMSAAPVSSRHKNETVNKNPQNNIQIIEIQDLQSQNRRNMLINCLLLL